MIIGPIAHYHENSRYYSAIPPQTDKEVDAALPHITIQMPVYKESLDAVLCVCLACPIADYLTAKIRAPSIELLKRAIQTYARQGGTSSIFVNDDGLRLLPPAEAAARLSFYATHNIGWVARPAHTYNAKTNPQGMCSYRRSGRLLQSDL